MRLLRGVVKSEGESLQKKVYDQIVQDSMGHPRNALQILDQVLGVDSDRRLQIASQAAEEQSESIALCRALMEGAGWKKIRNILSGLKEAETESIRRHVLSYCTSTLLRGDDLRAGEVMDEFVNPFFNSGFPGLVFACYTVVKASEGE